MPHDYRYDPFNDVSEAISITGETHVIPNNTPYTIRLKEVPKKETPSSISLTIGGSAANEVSAPPAAGEFWPDYSTKADNDDSWNTGTILFNAADAGKTVVVSYVGTGTLVDIEKTRKLHKCIKFTSSGEWICPEGVEHVNILLMGGGGGGIGSNGAVTFYKGTDGGNSVFGSILTAGGGKAGEKNVAKAAGSITNSLSIPILTAQYITGNPGAKGTSGSKNGTAATGYGNSGGGAYATSSSFDGVPVNTAGVAYQASGGGCLYAVAVPVTAGNTYTITIGAGGLGGNNICDGGNGAPGLCVIWYQGGLENA